MRRVAVLGGVRILLPLAYGLRRIVQSRHAERALGGLIDRFSLHGAHIDEVVGGAVVTHAKDWNLAREAVIGSALAPTTPGITMMQACGTSLQGALGLGAKIATGQIDCGIALGSDTTSDAPIVFKRSLLSAWCSSRGRKASARSSRSSKALPRQSLPPAAIHLGAAHRPRHGRALRADGQGMGITREAEDLLAYESHKKAAAPTIRASWTTWSLALGCSATTTSARTSRWKRWPS